MRIYPDSSIHEACYVIERQEPVIVPYETVTTNNEGEYRSVIFALQKALDCGFKEVEVLTDSLLVVNQVSGVWKCRKHHLLPLRDLARSLLALNRGITLAWLSREDNIAGKVLE